MGRLGILATALALLVAPSAALAELDELGLTTLEYAADGGRHRKLALERRIETVTWPMVKIAEATADRRHPLDPRKGLEVDAPLYRRLGVVDWAEEPATLEWPLLAGIYFPSDDRIALSRESRGDKRSAAHLVAVQLALLDHRTPLASIVKGDNRDHALAREAFVLGDATLMWLSRRTMPHADDLEARQRWAAGEVTALLPPPSAEGPSFGERYSRARLLAGLRALVALRDSSPWGVIDELYGRGAPATTADLLHPARLLEREPARVVTSGALAPLGDREQLSAGVVGELRLRLWLETWLQPDVAERVTTGWTGDGYVLYGPRSPAEPWTSTLVLMTTWDIAGASPDAEAQDFAGALVELVRARAETPPRAIEQAPEGTEAFLDARGLAILIERRDERVLYIEGCPPEQLAATREQVWTAWHVAEPSSGITGPLPPPPPIAAEPEPVPWYRRTPGLVALGLWLIVILPLLGYAGKRGGGLNPVRIYLYGLAATIALIVVGWFLGL